MWFDAHVFIKEYLMSLVMMAQNAVKALNMKHFLLNFLQLHKEETYDLRHSLNVPYIFTVNSPS